MTEQSYLQKLILDAAGEGIYGLDRKGKTTFANPAAIQILGWDLERIIGQPLHEIHHHSHEDGSPYPKQDCPIYSSIRDGKVHRVENEVFWRSDGVAISVEYTSTPILNNGVTEGVVVIFRDVSERRNIAAEQQAAFDNLAALQRQHQLILDAAGEGIYGLDENGFATFTNKAAVDLLGWSNQDICDRPIHDVHHHSHVDGSPYPRQDCPIYASIKDGEVHRIDDEVFWDNKGNAIPVEYTSTPIFNDDSQTGAVVIFRDIRQRKAMENEREQAYQQIKCLKEQLELERDYLREEHNLNTRFDEIIGESEILKRTLSQVSAVAPTTANVLILGESGVGKEMIAQAIHNQSDRSDRALIKVNCASIPKGLFESEFFGHVKGAFTGAYQDRVGRLQLADQGTVFLDEVGEIPIDLQGKLLRALQEGEFERVGEDTTISVDVRIVAATNRELLDEVKRGNFREDLYYRLSVFPIEVPPLKARPEDIPSLALHFLNLTCSNFNRDPLRVSQASLDRLKQHRWPGNIRELKNVIERAVILSTGTQLRLDLAMTNQQYPVSENFAQPHEDKTKLTFVTDAEFREKEKENIRGALQTSGNKVWGPQGAAELLGIKPSTLAHRMKMLGIAKSGHA